MSGRRGRGRGGDGGGDRGGGGGGWRGGGSGSRRGGGRGGGCRAVAGRSWCERWWGMEERCYGELEAALKSSREVTNSGCTDVDPALIKPCQQPAAESGGVGGRSHEDVMDARPRDPADTSWLYCEHIFPLIGCDDRLNDMRAYTSAWA